MELQVQPVSDLGPRSEVLDAKARLESLVHAHYDVVWRLARRWGLSAADADDVAQRTIVVIGRRLQQVEFGKERAFLCRTALHLASKVRARVQRRGEESVETWEQHVSDLPDPERLLEERRARVQLDLILSELPEPLRAVFVLFELESLTQVEVADALGIPQGTVASRIRRAREIVSGLIERNLQKNHKTGVSQ